MTGRIKQPILYRSVIQDDLDQLPLSAFTGKQKTMSTDPLTHEPSGDRQVSLPFQTLANSLASAEEKLHSFRLLFQSFAQTLQEATDRLVEVEKTIVQAKTALAQCEPQLQAEKRLDNQIRENDDRWSKKWSEREEQWGKIFAGMQQLLGQLSTAVPGLGTVPTNPGVLTSNNPTSSPLPNIVNEKEVFSVNEDFEVNQPAEEQTQQGQEENEGDFETAFDISQPQPYSQSETFGLADSADFALGQTAEQTGTMGNADSFAPNELEDDFELLDTSVQSNSSSMIPTQPNSSTSAGSTSTTLGTSEEADFELGGVKNGNVFNISELLKSFSTTDS